MALYYESVTYAGNTSGSFRKIDMNELKNIEIL